MTKTNQIESDLKSKKMKKIIFFLLVFSKIFAQETAEENAKIAYEFVMAGENADHLINKAIELDKNYPFTYVCRGLQNQYLKKNLEQAIKDFDLAIKLEDKTGYALYYKALILIDKDEKTACELLEKARELENYMALIFKKCN